MSRLRPVNGLIATHGVSSFGLGLVFPYTAIYLADLPNVGTAGVALYYACTGGANLATALLLSAGVVRLPRVALGVLGTLLWFVGYGAMAFVSTYPEVVASGVAIGTGQGCFMAAIIPLVSSLVTAEERRAVFARRYAVLNVTLALGSLVAGALTIMLPRTVIPYFFIANAIGVLPLTVAMLVAGRRIRSADKLAEASGEARDEPVVMPVLALWKLALPVATFQLAVYLFGFSQFEATAPLVSEKLMGMGLFTVSLMLVVNVVTIMVSQRFMTRLLESRTESTGLQVAVGLWVLGFVAAGAGTFGTYEVRLAGLLVYAVMFALGECAYSCSFHPWLISLVPDSELTRANALANSMMGIGNFAGPSIGVALALTGDPSVVWFGLAMCCTVVTIFTGMLASRRRLVTVS
ncbi:MAG TPA: MFS transporter [Micromonosporaceae bacterium]